MNLAFRTIFVSLLLLASPLHAACNGSVSQSVSVRFLDNPRSLLASNPRGDEGFIRIASALASGKAGTLKALTTIIADADLEHRNAIGAALGRAAIACAARQPEISRRIASAVKNISDDEVVRSYNRIAGAGLVPQIDAAPVGASPAFSPPLGADLSYSASRQSLSLPNTLRPLQPISEFK